MALIKLNRFAGENRALHPSLLPQEVGVISLNQKPGKGDLRPWKAPLNVASVPAGRATIYRMGLDVPSDTNYWLSWTADVNVVRGFNADDPAERTYFTGSGTPKWTDKARALASPPYPTAARDLGIPAPANAPTVITSVTSIAVTAVTVGQQYKILSVGTTDFTLMGSPNNTVGTIFTVTAVGTGTGTVRSNTSLETRFYAYTYVSDIGEEGANSPLSLAVTCNTDDTATISGFASPPSGNFGINRIRVYRTKTGGNGTSLFFLRELGASGTQTAGSFQVGVVYTIATVGTTNFTAVGASSNTVGTVFTATGAGSGSGTATYTNLTLSSTSDDLRSLGAGLATLNYLPAPGIPQGGVTNFTEPVLFGLIGLWNGMMAGISGRGVRFCEAYVPYSWPIAYEILPPEATPLALGKFGQTVVILTNANPILAYGGSPDSMDEQPVAFLQPLVSKKSVACVGDGVVWASNDGLCFIGKGGPKILTAGMMTRDDWQAINPSTIVGGFYEGRYIASYVQASVTKGFVIDPMEPEGILFTDFGYIAPYFDEYQTQLYMLASNGNISKWDSGSTLTTTFRSKQFNMPYPTSGFTKVMVAADAYPVTVKVYADGVLKATAVVTGPDPKTINGDYRAWAYNIEIVATTAVQEVTVAHSIEELKSS